MSLKFSLIDWDELKVEKFLDQISSNFPIKSYSTIFPNEDDINTDYDLKISITSGNPVSKSRFSKWAQKVLKHNSRNVKLSQKKPLTGSKGFYNHFSYSSSGRQFEEKDSTFVKNEVLASLIYEIINRSPPSIIQTRFERPFLALLKDGTIEEKIFADFCLDFFTTPCIFFIENRSENQGSILAYDEIKKQIIESGNLFYEYQSEKHFFDFEKAFPVVYICLADQIFSGSSIDNIANNQVLKVFIFVGKNHLPENVTSEWDLLINISRDSKTQIDTNHFSQGWLKADRFGSIFALIFIRSHTKFLFSVYNSGLPSLVGKIPISVVITTYKRHESLIKALESVIGQTINSDLYEIIIINNDPSDIFIRHLIESVIAKGENERKPLIRVFDCPIPGLSAARNTAIMHARGSYIFFLDDDAIADKDCIYNILQAYTEDPHAGVIGGHILLDSPLPTPKVLKRGFKRFWSHFETNFQEYTIVNEDKHFPWGANWSAKKSLLFAIGGFRQKYGRSKNDFSGGEELIASNLIMKLGFNIGIMPKAIAHHQPALDRYSYKYLFRTIRAQSIIHYRMVKDGYTSRKINLNSDFSGGRRFLKKLLIAIFSKPGEEKCSNLLEYFGYILGWSTVGFERLKDFFYRIRIELSE